MKTLQSFVDESLIKSYNHELLIKKLITKYNISNIHIYDSKSDVKSFYFNHNNLLIDKQEFVSLLNFYGYYITELYYIKSDNIYTYRIEPNFGTKCNDLVYKECKKKVYHITTEYNEQNIIKSGILPLECKNYRYFTERTFFVCGKNTEEIIYNIEHIISEKNIKNPVILEVDLSKYNVDFYYDTSENKQYNCIYANAVFFPHLIKSFNSIGKLKEELKINEAKYIDTNIGKLYIKEI